MGGIWPGVEVGKSNAYGDDGLDRIIQVWAGLEDQRSCSRQATGNFTENSNQPARKVDLELWVNV